MIKISKENAQAQLDLLLDYYLIDVQDVDQTDDFYTKNSKKDDVEEGKRSACKRLLRYIQHGLIEVTNDNGLTVTQRLRTPVGEISQLSYRVIDGKAQREMRWADDNDYMGKIYCLMGALSSVPDGANTISKFSGPDIGAVQCLGMIFLTA